MDNKLSAVVKETLRESAYRLVEVMILEGTSFRLVLWNNNNWNVSLPESIMESFPTQLVLDIKDMALDESFVDESNGDIIITTMFEGKEYSKVILYDEIIAVLDENGQPYILNNFEQEEVKPDKIFEPKPLTKDTLIDAIVYEGISKESAKRSLESFMKYNPNLNIKLKD